MTKNIQWLKKQLVLKKKQVSS